MSEDRTEEYFERIKANVREYYISKGYSEEKAEKIADATARKILIRQIGPKNAFAFFRRLKRRG